MILKGFLGASPEELGSRESSGAGDRDPITSLVLHTLPQELRAQTQDTLLRLREMAFEEKVRSELAWKYQQLG